MKRNTIAIIDKAPSKNDYSKYFEFDFDLFHMSSVPIPKLLKKNVDLVVDLDEYDLVILVGAEASKEYAKVTSVTNMIGVLIDDKYVCISNPAMLHFKPEGKPNFEKAVQKIHQYVSGESGMANLVGDFKGISTKEEAIEYFKEVLESNAAYVSMDTETSALYPRDGYILGISISYKAKQGRYIITDVLFEEALELLQKIIDKYTIVFHNLKFDFKMMEYHLGVKFRRNAVHDTMILHYLLDENDQHGLKHLALKYSDYGDYDAKLDEYKTTYCRDYGILQEDFSYEFIPFEIMWPYASADSGVTWELFAKFLPLVESNPKLKSVYYNIMLPGVLFLLDMEENGIPIDKERAEAAAAYLEVEILDAKEEIYAFPEVKAFQEAEGIIFNPASVIQLRKVLFDYAELPPTEKRTATGAISTDAEVLRELAELHPLPAALLKVRKLAKIQSSYITKILPELDADGRIRTNFNLTFTTSGRLSSSGKFNAQQIPRDDPIIKGLIVAPKGYKIVSQDLGTAEVYGAAVLSGDTDLIKVFESRGDFHSTIAKMVFNLSCEVEEVKKLYPLLRQAAKVITFSILYGSGPTNVAETVRKDNPEYTVEQAREDIKAYFARFPKLKKWLDTQKKSIERDGFIYTFFGRKRRLPNVNSADKGIAAHEVRSGVNALIQSWASDVNLLGAIDTANEVKARGLDAHIFMLVHDSIVALVREGQVEEYCEILKRNTQKDRGSSIPGCPVGVDQEIGDDYSFGKFEKYYKLESGVLSRISADKN